MEILKQYKHLNTRDLLNDHIPYEWNYFVAIKKDYLDFEPVTVASGVL